MSFIAGRGRNGWSGLRLLPFLLAAALVAPAFAFGSLPDCCVGKMPCCPGAEGANARGAASGAPTEGLKAPTPSCCQTMAPAGAPIADGRKATLPAPAAVALASDADLPGVALVDAGRVATLSEILFEDP